MALPTAASWRRVPCDRLPLLAAWAHFVQALLLPTLRPLAESLIARLHVDWGEAIGNYDEFRFFTGLRPSEQIALLVADYDARRGALAVTKATGAPSR